MLRYTTWSYAPWGWNEKQDYNFKDQLVTRHIRQKNSSGAIEQYYEQYAYDKWDWKTKSTYVGNLLREQHVKVRHAAGKLTNEYLMQYSYPEGTKQVAEILYRSLPDLQLTKKETFFWENGQWKYKTLYVYVPSLDGWFLKDQYHRIRDAAGKLIRANNYRCFYTSSWQFNFCREYTPAGKLLRQTSSTEWLVSY